MAARKNPGGNKGQDKLWSDAVRRAVNRAQKGKKTKRLEILADKLLDEGEAGNIAALKEIGDRLDGRPAQAIFSEEDHPLRVLITTGVPDREDDDDEGSES